MEEKTIYDKVLTEDGRMTEEFLEEVKAMSREELIEFVVHINSVWNEMFYALELQHSQEMDRLKVWCEEELTRLETHITEQQSSLSENFRNLLEKSKFLSKWL